MAQIQFKGKQFVQNHHLSVEYHELIPDKKKSLTDTVSLKDNLIIHGDNLKALKALLPTYAGQVKCIYIDPPYNTGNENWAYNDNVNSPMMQEWLGKAVDKDDLTKHDKWLCMMLPRLKLLRELLTEDGIIFASIDDIEVHHLRALMDEVFGEDCFLATFARRTKIGGGSAAAAFAVEHDYVLAYCRDKDSLDPLFIPHDPEYLKRYAEEDKDGSFFWDTMERSSTATKPYKITAPDGTILTGKWFRNEKRFLDDLKTGEVKIMKLKDGSWTVQFKQRMGNGRKLRSLMYENDYKSSQEEVEEFGISGFPYPKPLFLLKRLIQSATDKDSIILDSFAGSGTTGHAVLSLNKEDGGNRHFILVECEDYADKVTAERVRRVIKGIPKAANETLKKGLGGAFSYFELGNPIIPENLLTGKNMPTYKELARYVFYTATGEEFNEKAVNEKRNFIGETTKYEVYMFYKPDVEYLKKTALTLDMAKSLPATKKKRLIFAPAKFLDQEQLDTYNIHFSQLPFEIYRRI